ncbi:hypothetical protein O6H91_05G126300 [Diphasiastrum complanatum]|uniref:Uncharacterized protein n=1 Tax=Diphasiastrum complanatum TaxID=34168 RepID=A0ACC2DSW2_DIPCM|nr:hypothetical protein O6H91_05G126300 [Diphasiastrum complanatum]
MGGLCCSPMPEELEDYATYRNGIFYQRCSCLGGCIRWFLNVHAGVFDRLEEHDSSISSPEATSASAGPPVPRAFDTSIIDTYRAPPRPLPYDADIRYARLQRDGLISRRDKIGISHLHGGEVESMRRTSSDLSGESLPMLPRRMGVELVDQVGNQQPSKSLGKVDSTLSLVEDEDICPTCLDVYTEENPKINMECGHHFHLACTLEWMERSKLCPVCDKEMVFEESF